MTTGPHNGAAAPAATLSDAAYSALIARIDGGTLAAHQRLPGEIELARQLGVSRPVLRQALERLRGEGRVYARKGAGNFIAGLASSNTTPLAYGPLGNIPDVRHLLEFRCALESEAAAKAAENRSREALQRIRLLRQRITESIAAGGTGIDEDIAFHVAIAEASGNRFYVVTVRALVDQMRYAVKLVRDLSTPIAPARFAQVKREHAAIDAAIAKGDPQAAREAMRAHLAGGIARLFGQAEARND